MSSKTATPAIPMTRDLLRTRLAAIEAEVQELRRAIDSEDGIDELNEAMRSIDRNEGLPGREALAALRQDLGLPARGDRAAR